MFYSLLISVAGIIVLVVALRLMGVEEIAWDKYKVKFFSRLQPNLRVSPFNSLDVVVSSDGNIYKIHLLVSILRSADINITSWWLRISGISKMVFRQYFITDEKGIRTSLPKSYHPIPDIGQSMIIGLEFEREMKWEKIMFKRRVYRAKLEWESSEGKRSVNIKFRVREQNLKSIENASEQARQTKTVTVLSLPRVS